MSINLLELMQGAVGNHVGEMAKQIGVDEANAKKAVGGILPAVLGGLIGKAEPPEGAEKLNQTLDQVDDSLIDDIGGVLGGGNDAGEKLITQGKDMIGNLFGDKVTGVIDMISNISGLNKEGAGGLLGMIAPIIFSLLAKQKKALGLDAKGFANLILDQKEHLNAALPAGMAGVLGIGKADVGATVDAAKEKAQVATAGASAAVDSAKSAPTATASAAATQVAAKAKGGGGGILKVVLLLLIVGAIGFLAYKFAFKDSTNGGSSINVPDTVGEGFPSQITAANAVDALKSIMSDATANVKGIKNVESARVAVSNFKTMENQIRTMTRSLSQLPQPVKAQLSQEVQDFAPGFVKQVDKAYKIPGVQSILEPTVEPLMRLMESFVR